MIFVPLTRRLAMVVTLVVAIACTSDPAPSPPSREAQDLRWERMTDAPTPRTEVTATTDGSLIYVIGGFDDARESVATAEIFDPAGNAWRSGPDLPVAVNHAMSAQLDGDIYVFGGYLGPGLSNPTDRAFVLRGGAWQEIASMPEPRAAAGAAAVAGSLYVAGGVGPDGLGQGMLVLDPRREHWRTIEGPPTPREHLGVAAVDGRVFVVGGRTGGIGSNLAAAEAYDPGSGEWSTLPDMPSARGGIAATATANGYVVAVGGEGDEAFDEAEAFGADSERWIRLPPMPTARHGLGVVAVGTVIYVIAGGIEPGYSFSAANESLDLGDL